MRPTIWFRGRLDNRSELSARLGLEAGVTYQVLLEAAFERWQTECVTYLRGPFALAITLPELRFKLIARDPSGEEPLYYSLIGNDITVAQTIGELTIKPEAQDLDETAIAQWLHTPRCLRTETFYRKIYKLPPGHSLISENSHLRVTRYWQPERLPLLSFEDPRELWREYASVIQTAVCKSIQSTTLGCHASGGLDSSAIFLLAQNICRQTKQPVFPFSWHAFPPYEVDASHREYNSITQLAALSDQQMQHCPLEAATLREVLTQDVTQRPWMSANVIMMERAVQNAAKRSNVKLMLTGWGGDEIASQGYSFRHRIHCLKQSKWAAYQQSLRRPAAWRMVTSDILHLFGRRIHSRSTKIASKDVFLHPNWQSNLMPSPQDAKPKSDSLFPWALNIWNRGHISERIDAYYDSGRENNIRYAHPLLNQDVMEFALRIPFYAAVGHTHNRWPFRQAMSGILPESILWSKDKSEPLRVDAARSTMRAALTEIGHLIRTRSTQPKRAGFFDMPKLMRALEPDALANRRHFGPICRALSFLDF